MLIVPCFKLNTQIAAVDIFALVRTLVVNGYNVAAEICDDLRYTLKLTGLVDKSNVELTGTTRLDKTSLDHS